MRRRVDAGANSKDETHLEVVGDVGVAHGQILDRGEGRGERRQ